VPSPAFKTHLQRQLAFLIRSCAAFDGGFHEEAIRIATVVRTLVHQTPKSTSLLKHLNATTIRLLSTCPPTGPGTVVSLGMGTASFCSETGWSYQPSLGGGPFREFIPLSKWWTQEVMVRHPVRLTRRKIVLAAANQDGGAHVDAQLDTEYQALASAGFAGTVTQQASGVSNSRPLERSHFICLRQIGYELLNSPELHAAGTDVSQ
jgi:hypothetical protein